MGTVVRFPSAYKPRQERAQPTTAPVAGPGPVDRLLGVVQDIVAILFYIIIIPLAPWTFIEFVRIAFGHPAWHAIAYFATMVFLYWFVGVYRPKGKQ